MSYRIHKAANPFIAISGIITIFSFLLFPALGWFFLILTMYIAYFFRYPIHKTVYEENYIYSPAWGLVTSIEEKDTHKSISIFLNIFDVHTQYIPYSGIVQSVEYKKGLFKNAMAPDTSHLNESNNLTIKITPERTIEVKQIAGLIARRILSWVEPEQKVETGYLYGLIRFGSRVDITLPKEVEILVSPKEKIKGGLTPIAAWKDLSTPNETSHETN